jgi:hypothetical protein
MNDSILTVQTHTATVTITVSVDGDSTLYTVTGETDGDGFRLANQLLRAAKEDADDYLFERQR